MSNLVKHAEFELRKMIASEDEMSRLMAEQVIEIVALFASHGHSGSSAPYAASLITPLLKFEPIGPLTGEDDEWVEVSEGVFQNKRCSHVFKRNGSAYDIEGRIFREANGCCYTSFESRTPVTFPYIPTREYVAAPTPTETKEGTP